MPVKNRAWLIAALLVVLTLAAFWPVAGSDFVAFDDDAYVYDNPEVKDGLTLHGLAWACTTFTNANWHPLTWISFMADVQLFGVSPGAHHIVNLVLHLATALLLFRLLLVMTGGLWQSGAVAALFAVHPLHVESVAWISERKDVLSALFWMATIWSYRRYLGTRRRRDYALTLGLFTVGLLAKPMLLTLPFVLLLLDFWPLGRFQPSATSRRAIAGKILLEKIPFLLPVAGSVIITWIALAQGEAILSSARLSFSGRIANALVSYALYLWKTVWPLDLSFFYLPPKNGWPVWAPIVAGLPVAAMAAISVIIWRRRPYVAMGWFWYLGTLVPVIGLLKAGLLARADRYTYLPLVGIFIILVWGVAEAAAGLKGRQAIIGVSCCVVILALVVLANIQVRFWHNTDTLAAHAIEIDPDNWVAHQLLADVLLARGDQAGADRHYSRVMELLPSLSHRGLNLRKVLARKKAVEDSDSQLGAHLDRNQADVQALVKSGNTLAMQGKTDEAITRYREALRLEPGQVEALIGLGNLLVQKGERAQGLESFRRADAIDPKIAGIKFNIGFVLIAEGNYEDGVSYYQQALALDPTFEPALVNLGAALVFLGRFDEAIGHFQQALRLNPGDDKARFGLEQAQRLKSR